MCSSLSMLYICLGLLIRKLDQDFQVAPKYRKIVVIPFHIPGSGLVDFELESAKEVRKGEV
jgi:hypothetical protein